MRALPLLIFNAPLKNLGILLRTIFLMLSRRVIALFGKIVKVEYCMR